MPKVFRSSKRCGNNNAPATWLQTSSNLGAVLSLISNFSRADEAKIIKQGMRQFVSDRKSCWREQPRDLEESFPSHRRQTLPRNPRSRRGHIARRQ